MGSERLSVVAENANQVNWALSGQSGRHQEEMVLCDLT